MKIETKNGNVHLVGVKNFDLAQTFDCGQCFRFNRTDDGGFCGVAFGKYIKMNSINDEIVFYNTTAAELESRWIPFFDLERDYGKIIDSFSFDDHLTTAAKSGSGIRILAQDPWETLVSFIISQNNNIPRIKKIIESLCQLCGDKIDENIYSFPSPERILSLGVEGLSPIKSGFRAKYIIDAAEKVSSGAIVLDELKGIDEAVAREKLKTIKGVGDKVASCVMLFGLGYLGSFPIDVWVKRVLEKYYPSDFDPSVFGEYAGIAQQYLFYYERG